MDVGEEQDVLLQRAASSYLDELRASLPKFLFQQQAARQPKPRRRVRASTAAHMVALLEPFQEWPQLLDPHLQSIVGPLAVALLEASQEQSRGPGSHAESGLVVSLSRAICRLLYTLCKIRGPKVISRLLNNEAEILESILERLEDMVQPAGDGAAKVTWEEKYVYMLWLSHLLFAPFDLATIGSSAQVRLLPPADLKLPPALPPIVPRLVGVAVMHLSSAGKEREAAVALLSRLASRPDMVRLGLLAGLIDWSLESLKHPSSSAQATPYGSIGILNLLGALASAVGAGVLEPFLLRIFRDVITLASGADSGAIVASAVGRKAVIKVLRILTLSALQLSESHPNLSEFVLEDVVDHLLNSLADNDTPVRRSASKAISVITVKLSPEMGAEIVEAVLGSLEENVLWAEQAGAQATKSQHTKPRSRQRTRDLSAVNPLRWHGLVLTLSQLLFQRLAPSSQLPTVLNSLLLALQFEKRASSGTSQGTNVRDAANFGIWSIARKYSTKELLGVSPPAVESHFATVHATASTLQLIAGELVVAACLDPSGNIRRGSSAALQELIGRHPDTIIKGISIVQKVDYHSVALRSRAICSVALDAAKLDRFYWARLVDALFGWRGLRASDLPSRRLASEALGALADIYGLEGFVEVSNNLQAQLHGLNRREIEARHGLFLAAASLARTKHHHAEARETLSRLWEMLLPGQVFDQNDLLSSTKRPEQTAEAVSEAVCSFFIASSPSIGNMAQPSNELVTACEGYLELALQRREEVVITSASKAGAQLYQQSSIKMKQELVGRWANNVMSHHAGGNTTSSHGFLAALSEIYSTTSDQAEQILNQRIRVTLISLLSKASRAEIETKVVALKGLDDGIISQITSLDPELVEVLGSCLQDYTIDQRGDVGSLVRLEAIAAVKNAASRNLINSTEAHKKLVALVAVLAGEKLDKVRFGAWNCLRQCRQLFGPGDLATATFETIGQTSGVKYYEELVRLLAIEWLRRPLLQGLAVSMGAGSESVLRASRLALSEYYERAGTLEGSSLVLTMLWLLRDNLDQDRLVIPLLETWAYLFQSQIISRLGVLALPPEFSFKKLFVQVQKAHFKSGNVQKLTAAVGVYRSLAGVQDIRGEVLQKLNSMLFHPLPRVRNAAADALYGNTEQPKMLAVDWSKSPKQLKQAWSP